MKKSVFFCAVLIYASSAQAMDDTSYVSLIEQQAAVAEQMDQTSYASNSWQQTSLARKMAEVKRISPVAARVYEHLGPAAQAEVRKALLRGRDPHEVVSLILERNQS